MAVQMAWDGHFAAFETQDVDQILQVTTRLLVTARSLTRSLCRVTAIRPSFLHLTLRPVTEHSAGALALLLVLSLSSECPYSGCYHSQCTTAVALTVFSLQ